MYHRVCSWKWKSTWRYDQVFHWRGSGIHDCGVYCGVKAIKDWVKESEALRNLVQKCGGRHVFDHKYCNNSNQVEALTQHYWGNGKSKWILLLLRASGDMSEQEIIKKPNETIYNRKLKSSNVNATVCVVGISLSAHYFWQPSRVISSRVSAQVHSQTCFWFLLFVMYSTVVIKTTCKSHMFGQMF